MRVILCGDMMGLLRVVRVPIYNVGDCVLLCMYTPVSYISDQKVGLSGNSGRVFTVHSAVPLPKVVAQHLVEWGVDTVVVPRCEDAAQILSEIFRLTDRECGVEVSPFVTVASGIGENAKDQEERALLLCMQFIEEWNNANSCSYSIDFAEELLLAHNEIWLNSVDLGLACASLLNREFSDKGSFALELLAGFENWCVHRNVTMPFQGCQDRVEGYVKNLQSRADKVAVVGVSFNWLFVHFLKLLLAGVPDSQVVLPFLDLGLSASKWEALDSSHCQHYLRKLLVELEVDRKDVVVIGDFDRNTLVNMLFNCGSAEGHFVSGCDLGVRSNIELITCDTVGDEGRKIVEILRMHSTNLKLADGVANVGEPNTHGRICGASAWGKLCPGMSEGKSSEAVYNQVLDAPCVLFIEDDALASRVRAELLGKSTAISTGDIDYMVCSLIMCVLEVVRSGGEATKLLAALKHPMVGLGLNGGDYAATLSGFELSIIRESTASGFEMISKIIDLSDGRFTQFWDAVIFAFAPLVELTGLCTLERMSREHLSCLKSLVDREYLDEPLLRDAVVKIDEFFSMLRSCCKKTEVFSIANYSVLIEEIVGHYFSERKGNSILSAFFVNSGAVMISGFNEGEFTRLHRSFLLNDEVRSRLGLPTTEEYCGYFAYIMYGLLHARRVYITRSEESCGQVKEAPLLVRYLDFLLSLVSQSDNAVPTESSNWSSVNVSTLVAVDVPNPPLEIRKRAFSSLTAESVDTLLNNPFAFYARYIVGVKFVRRIDISSVAKNFSGTVRRILSKYLEQVGLGTDYCALMDVARKEFETIKGHYPYVSDLWWPRFERISKEFFQIDSERKQGVVEIKIDETFTWNVGQNIRVTSKCDRVEYHADGAVTVVCHKVGAIPSQIDVRCGLASRGVIDSISVAEERHSAGRISFEYWKIAPEAVEVTAVEDFASVLESARQGIGNFLRVYSEEMIPFYPRADFSKFAEYELFSRIGEREVTLETHGN